jgi:hypothetical protein
MEDNSNPQGQEKILTPDFRRRIIKKHKSGAIVRSGAALIMGLFVYLAYVPNSRTSLTLF